MIEASAEPTKPITLTHKIDPIAYGAAIITARESLKPQATSVYGKPTTRANETHPTLKR